MSGMDPDRVRELLKHASENAAPICVWCYEPIKEGEVKVHFEGGWWHGSCVARAEAGETPPKKPTVGYGLWAVTTSPASMAEFEEMASLKRNAQRAAEGFRLDPPKPNQFGRTKPHPLAHPILRENP